MNFSAFHWKTLETSRADAYANSHTYTMTTLISMQMPQCRLRKRKCCWAVWRAFWQECFRCGAVRVSPASQTSSTINNFRVRHLRRQMHRQKVSRLGPSSRFSDQFNCLTRKIFIYTIKMVSFGIRRHTVNNHSASCLWRISTISAIILLYFTPREHLHADTLSLSLPLALLPFYGTVIAGVKFETITQF